MTQPPVAVVHIVDDDATILRLFERLASEASWELRTWQLGGQFLDAADLDAHGCLVLDLNLPDISGHEVVEAMVRRGSTMPVIFMSGAAAVSDAVRALKHGSLDFVEKPFAIREMSARIQLALEHDLGSRSATAQRSEIEVRFTSLTPREREVMERVIRGLPNKLIAAELAIRPKTVEVHRANVMTKTRAGSIAELVRMALMLKGDNAT